MINFLIQAGTGSGGSLLANVVAVFLIRTVARSLEV